jgi:hypothetical protein
VNSIVKFGYMETPAGTKVAFTKFDGGVLLPGEGSLQSMTDQFLIVEVSSDDGTKVLVKFRRQPGSTSGWGTGNAKHWRITEPERKVYCHADLPRRRLNLGSPGS